MDRHPGALGGGGQPVDQARRLHPGAVRRVEATTGSVDVDPRRHGVGVEQIPGELLPQLAPFGIGDLAQALKLGV
jgi:hypothetical protein